MVTVVRRNNLTCTCPRCISDLSYTYDEITEHKINQDYLGDSELVRGIECPVCKSIIKVK